MKKYSIFYAIGLAAAVFFATVFSFCTNESSKEKEATTADNAISAQPVTSETCASCHQDIYKSYLQTGKGKAFHAPSKQNLIEKFTPEATVFDKHHNLWYWAFWRGDTAMFIAEFRLEKQDTVHYREEKVDFVIGSGNQARTYIHVENGYHYELPITWYTKKGIWDLSPGYEGGANSRFERPVGDQCMNCHNSEMNFVANSVNKFVSVGKGIGCDKCHGDGAAHVQKHSKNPQVKSSLPDESIVNPARLGVQLQMDVCRQCHLEGIAVPKPNQTLTDFKAGEPLRNHWDVFIPTPENRQEEYGFASHAERLQQSKCFIVSAGKLNCTTCHDPHKPLTDNPINTYNEKCMGCHSGNAHEKACKREAKTADANNCVSCHLTKSGTTDIPHVSSSDHLIRVYKKTKSKPTKASKNMVFKNFSDSLIEPRALAYAYLNQYEIADKNPAYLDSVARFLNSLEAMQQLRFHSHRKTLPPDSLLHLHFMKITDAYMAFFLAEIRNKAGLAATQYYERSLALAPDNLQFMFNTAVAYTNYGQIEKAKKLYEDLLKRNPRDGKTLVNLAVIYMDENQLAKSEELVKKAMRLHPDYVLAKENYVKVLLMQAKDTEALRQLEQLKKQQPKNKQYKQLYEQLTGKSS